MDRTDPPMRHVLRIPAGELVLLDLKTGSMEPAFPKAWEPVTREALEKKKAIILKLTWPFEIQSKVPFA